MDRDFTSNISTYNRKGSSIMKKPTWKIAIATFAALATMIVPAQAGNPNCTEVDGDYIVSFPTGANVADEIRNSSGRPIKAKFIFNSVLNGFAANLTAEQVCAFKKRSGALVELDDTVTASVVKTLSNSEPWGIDRIDQISNKLDSNFNIDSSGSKVFVFVFDSGIRISHEQFMRNGSSIVSTTGYDAIKDGYGLNDCAGHGTHVSGTVGGKDTGVASAVTLVPVRVLGCNGSGSWSGVIAGLDYVATNTLLRPAVVTMSLGGKLNKSLNSSLQKFIRNYGITAVVAAGNDGRDACQFSPAAVPEAITVGASDRNDRIANFSNKGSCVDIYAPGVGIFSSIKDSDSSYGSWNGTSMATPHVTGIIARYLEINSKATPSQVAIAVQSKSNPLGTTGLRIACLTGANECANK